MLWVDQWTSNSTNTNKSYKKCVPFALKESQSLLQSERIPWWRPDTEVLKPPTRSYLTFKVMLREVLYGLKDRSGRNLHIWLTVRWLIRLWQYRDKIKLLIPEVRFTTTEGTIHFKRIFIGLVFFIRNYNLCWYNMVFPFGCTLRSLLIYV